MACGSMYAGAVTACETGVVVGEEGEGHRTAKGDGMGTEMIAIEDNGIGGGGECNGC
jgi:hypothetical protein